MRRDHELLGLHIAQARSAMQRMFDQRFLKALDDYDSTTPRRSYEEMTADEQRAIRRMELYGSSVCIHDDGTMDVIPGGPHITKEEILEDLVQSLVNMPKGCVGLE